MNATIIHAKILRRKYQKPIKSRAQRHSIENRKNSKDIKYKYNIQRASDSVRLQEKLEIYEFIVSRF